jgi:hypothetical protein
VAAQHSQQQSGKGSGKRNGTFVSGRCGTGTGIVNFTMIGTVAGSETGKGPGVEGMSGTDLVTGKQ